MAVVTTDPARHPDLRALEATQRWSALEAEAAAGDVLAALALRTWHGADEVTDQVVARVTSGIATYGATGEVDTTDLWWSVNRNLELNLVTLAERRPATAEELASRAELGRRRAEAGLGIGDVLRAYHVGYMVFWEAITDNARAQGQPAIDALLDHAGHIWSVLDEITTAVEHAHREYLAIRNVSTRKLGLRLISELRSGPSRRGEAERAARDLGLNPTDAFLFSVAPAHVTPLGDIGGGVIIEEPDRTVVVTQPEDPSSTAEKRLAEQLQHAGCDRVGVGLSHMGIGGAAASLVGAERAYRAAQSAGLSVCAFREQWLECLILEFAPALDDIAIDAVRAIVQAPSMRATVETMLHVDANVSAAARLLEVHPNTVTYRLNQFEQQTGLDPRTTDGALGVRLALTLAAARSQNGTSH
jgi:hypothetical protein